MKDFEIIIEEVVSDTFLVKAKDYEEAMEIATKKYNDGEFVLEPGNLESRTMAARDIETGEETSFIDF